MNKKRSIQKEGKENESSESSKQKKDKGMAAGQEVQDPL
jgi:hypothetical protein